ncbi:MAG: glycoside hydrolase family 75 protein [Pseudorhodoplanes sp.]
MAARLNDLVPDFREKVATLLRRCAARGIRMVPSEGVRTPAQQAIYWRQSRSRTEIDAAIDMLRREGAQYIASVLESVGPQHGDEVTKVLPGNSWHQWGEAVDCFWEVDGRAEWSTSRKINGLNGYRVYADEARSLGLEAGLFWQRFKDAPHVQKRSTANPRTSGLSWADIDRTMKERFGTMPMDNTADEIAIGRDNIRLSYEAPEGWRVYESTDTPAVLFRAKMTICADGAPRAYHSNDAIALDYLANAGRPGNWWALVTDASGEPIVQSETDPAPGYYVSTTALTNPTSDPSKPTRFIDAATIPYAVCPGRRYSSFSTGRILRLGDVGVAYNTRNGRLSYVQFGETGPATKIGEGSIALAERLGIPASAKNGGTSRREVIYLLFPGSGIGRGLSVHEIETRAQPLFEVWGGIARLRSYEGI